MIAHSVAGAQWSRVPDIPSNRSVYALLATDDTLYAATDSLFYLSADGGTSWSSGKSPVNAPDAMSCLQKVRGEVLVGTFKSGVFRSEDEGATWLPFSDGLAGLGATDIGNLQIRRDSLIVGTLGAGVFATAADFSRPWSALGDSLSEYQGDNVFGMQVIGTTVLVGGGANGYMFRYTDDQPWWNPIAINTPRLVGQYVSGMATDGAAVVTGTNTGVYRSTDQGLSWERRSFPLPPSTIQTFLLFHGAALFAVAATPVSSSLFATTDLGDTWNPLRVVPLPNVLSAAIVGDTLFLGSADGLWKAAISQLNTSVSDRSTLPGRFSLEQNYPNPFNPTTYIRYRIAESRLVELRVYDILGREVRTLVNEVKQPGQYTVEFDAAGLASGVYSYRIKAHPDNGSQAEEFVAARRLVLLR